MMMHQQANQRRLGEQQQAPVGQQQQAKAHKGWLSRWTRKQWSRHWFVLKSGSLTYYRGPAAELCSFLDGVLDLSLIKHIEVPPADEAAKQPASQQQLFTFTLRMWSGESHQLATATHADRSFWLAAINASTGDQLDDETSTDSAGSSDSNLYDLSPPAQRQSRGSLDGAPVGGQLSSSVSFGLRRHSANEVCSFAIDSRRRLRCRDELAAEELASAEIRRKGSKLAQMIQEQDTLGIKALAIKSDCNRENNSINNNNNNSNSNDNNIHTLNNDEKSRLAATSLPAETPATTTSSKTTSDNEHKNKDDELQQESPLRYSSCLAANNKQQDRVSTSNCNRSSREAATSAPLALPCEQSPISTTTNAPADSSYRQADDKQALKRRLVSLQGAQTSEPLKLVARHQEQPAGGDLFADIRRRLSEGLALAEEPAHELGGSAGGQQPAGRKCLLRLEEPMSVERQKKSVTFDLSESTMHALSGSSSSSSSPSSSPQSSDCSSIEQDSDDCSESEADSEPLEAGQPASCSSASLAAATTGGATATPTSVACRPQNEATSSGLELRLRARELETQLAAARDSVGHLEWKLSNSYASYQKLEASYKQVEGELASANELHKADVSRLQLKVDQLTRDLTSSQLKLVETREKLIGYENLLAKQQLSDRLLSHSQSALDGQEQRQLPAQQHHHHHHHHLHRASGNLRPAMSWLKASQQVSSSGQHQPLMLMHHMKHSLSASQQSLGAKLLNQSRQIQRKLGELELKMDQIHASGAMVPTSQESRNQEPDGDKRLVSQL